MILDKNMMMNLFLWIQDGFILLSIYELSQ